MNDDIRTQLLEAAILAPCADNKTPYMLSWDVSGKKLLMSLNPECCGEASDKLFTLSDLAIGTALESLVLRALSLEHEASITLFPSEHSSGKIKFVVAEIQFTDSVKQDSIELSLAKQIPFRCTDRRFPFTGDISNEVIESIKSSISDPLYKIHAFKNKKDIVSIIPIIYRAEKTRFESELLHKELFSSVAFTRKYIPTGMNLNVIGVNWYETLAFYCVSKWKLLKIFNLLGASRFLAFKSVTLPIKNSPALLLLSVPVGSRQCIIEAGRQMLRIWLKCTELDLAVQIYAAPGVLSLVQPVQEEKIVKVLEKVSEDLSKITGKDRHGLIFFRIGKKAGKPERSGRCDVSKVTG